jgi:hypothetical protein
MPQLLYPEEIIPAPIQEEAGWARISSNAVQKAKAVPLHAMKVLGGRGHIASIHSRPRN